MTKPKKTRLTSRRKSAPENVRGIVVIDKTGIIERESK
jgi:hypothetical protein